MRTIVLNLAVSMDGFIARENGSVDWLDDLDTDGNDLGFQDFLSGCDTILMGRVSYEETLKLGKGDWPFKNHKTYVFTSKQRKNEKGIFFVNDNPINLIKELGNGEGKNIWLFGGGRFIKTMREHNLVDQYIITIIPVLLGKGIRLFQDVDMENKLLLLTSEKYKDIVQSHYKVIR